MSYVNFIRLGLTNPVTNASYLEAITNNPNAIIFAKVADQNGEWSDTSKSYNPPAHYIYANGIEYNVADSSALSYTYDQVKLLQGPDTSAGSVAKMIKDAIATYNASLASHFMNIIDPTGNVNVEMSGDSSIKLSVESRKVDITVGSTLPATGEHGDYFIVQDTSGGVLYNQTAYVWDSSTAKWVALNGNVNAANVYFPEGIQRTAAWGIATKSDDILTEYQGKNLKELLEGYLVEEIYPTVKTTTGSAKYAQYTMSLATPGNITTYIDKSGLQEVGTTVSFTGISIEEKANHDGTTTQVGTGSTITGMKYGCATTVGGTVDKDATEKTAAATTATATYTTNFSSASASMTLTNVSGYTGINTVTASITDLSSTNTLSLSSASGTIAHGTNKLTLTWTNDATVTRSISGDPVAAINTVYYASNKYNTSSGKSASTPSVSWTDQRATAPAITYTATSIEATGVYPLYTNGKKQSISDTTGQWTTSTITVEGATVAGEKMELVNYITGVGSTYYYGFGDCESTLPKIFYIPTIANITSVTGYAYNSNKESGKEASYDAGCGTWTADATTVHINGVEYTKFVNTGKFCAQNIKINFSK